MGKNASYEGNTPCRPVRTYPWYSPIIIIENTFRMRERDDGDQLIKEPWRVCSESISITLPPLCAVVGSYWKFRVVTSNTPSNCVKESRQLYKNRAGLWKLALLDDNSSGEKIRNVEGFLLITSVRYVPMAFI